LIIFPEGVHQPNNSHLKHKSSDERQRALTMARLVPSSPQGQELTTNTASDLIKQILQNARQLKTVAASLDASQIGLAAQDATVWPNLVQTSITSLLTQKTLFDLAIPTLSPEIAQLLEPLRAATETALQGVRGLQDADKVR
jgi:hypothetical protein